MLQKDRWTYFLLNWELRDGFLKGWCLRRTVVDLTQLSCSTYYVPNTVQDTDHIAADFILIATL